MGTVHRSRRKKTLILHFFFLFGGHFKIPFFSSLVKQWRKIKFSKQNTFWGELAIRLFYILVDMARDSLPATCSIPLPYVNFVVSKVSSQIWPKTSRSEGDEQRESFQHCQPKSVLIFSVEVQKSKHNGQPRQGGQDQDICL